MVNLIPRIRGFFWVFFAQFYSKNRKGCPISRECSARPFSLSFVA